MAVGVRKFTYDRVYTPDGRVLHVDDAERLSFRPDEVVEAKKKAFEDGQRSAVAEAERAAAQALQSIADQLSHIQAALGEQCATLRRDAVELGMAGARAAADEALARFPDEQLAALFETCLESLRGAPVVVAHAPEAACETVRARLAAVAEQAGLETAVKVEPGAGPARLEWATGAVSIDPEFALARAREAAERWLAAEDARAGQLNLFNPESPHD